MSEELVLPWVGEKETIEDIIARNKELDALYAMLRLKKKLQEEFGTDPDELNAIIADREYSSVAEKYINEFELDVNGKIFNVTNKDVVDSMSEEDFNNFKNTFDHLLDEGLLVPSIALKCASNISSRSGGKCDYQIESEPVPEVFQDCFKNTDYKINTDITPVDNYSRWLDEVEDNMEETFDKAKTPSAYYSNHLFADLYSKFVENADEGDNNDPPSEDS